MSEVAPTHQGRALIKAWQEAVQRESTARREQIQAEHRERETRKALGAWLAPKDAKPGEKFGIWERDRHDNEILFEVTVSSDPTVPPAISARSRN